jgi:hypothetical protein
VYRKAIFHVVVIQRFHIGRDLFGFRFSPGFFLFHDLADFLRGDGMAQLRGGLREAGDHLIPIMNRKPGEKDEGL